MFTICCPPVAKNNRLIPVQDFNMIKALNIFHMFPLTEVTPIFELLPGCLDLDAAAQLFQDEFPSVVVNDEHTILLVRSFVSFEYRHGRRGALEGQQ